MEDDGFAIHRYFQRVKLFADHHQIVLQSFMAKGDLADAWTVQATEDRVAAAGDIVAFGTQHADDCEVTVEVLNAEPKLNSKAQHITESSLQLKAPDVALCGVTDYVPDAHRISLAAGSWRVRASHSKLEKPPERIHLQLWPAPVAAVSVLKRFVAAPAKKAKPATGKPKNVKQATQLARQGSPDAALEALLELAAAGEVAASASAAELLAFQGQWAAMVPHATALLARPTAVYAGNVFTDMAGLIRRAARELNDPSIIDAAAKVIPPGMEMRRDAVLLKDAISPSAMPGPADVASFEKAVAESETGKRFKGKPLELARHCFALAVAFKCEDEVLKRWKPQELQLPFDHAVTVARIQARRGDAAKAWQTLQAQLTQWWPLDAAQVAPVILLTDPWLSPLMTPARCREVLETPRGA